MRRFFCNAPAYFLRRLRWSFASNSFYRTITGASLFSFALASTHLFESLSQKDEDVNKLVSLVPDIEISNQHALVCLFQKFASVEVNGEVYMTPRDFIDCVAGARPPVSARRHVIDAHMAEQLIAKTPHISSGYSALFQTLDRSGLISCSEYLFLLSILTNSSYNLQVLFRMFDLDGSECIDISEFLQIIELCNMKFQAGNSNKQSVSKCSTTIQRHFFDKDGRGKLMYKDFLKFISVLQTEVLRAEFYRFSLGSDTISPLQFSQAILRYAELPEKMKEKGLEHVAESIMFEKDSIDFESYCSFFNLLFRHEDLYSALKMYMISNRAISKEEFQRAARAVTGQRLNDVVVNTVFLLFDTDGDGHLSTEEFITVTRSYLARGTHGRLVDESKVQSFTSCVGRRMRATM